MAALQALSEYLALLYLRAQEQLTIFAQLLKARKSPFSDKVQPFWRAGGAV